MKKKIFLLLVISLMALAPAAQAKNAGQGVHEPGTGLNEPDVKVENQGSGIGIEVTDVEVETATSPAADGASGAVGNNSATQVNQRESDARAENVEVSESAQAIQNQERTNTANQGEEKALQNTIREQIESGEYSLPNGNEVQVRAQEENRVSLKSNGVEAMTSLPLACTEEAAGNGCQRLEVVLSDEETAVVDVLPDEAVVAAAVVLGSSDCIINSDCTVELVEAEIDDQVKAVYEVKTQQQTKVLGLFKAQMKVTAQVDSENGEVLQVKKPWWSFLAF